MLKLHPNAATSSTNSAIFQAEQPFLVVFAALFEQQRASRVAYLTLTTDQYSIQVEV
jgi:hypothetical protein